MKNHIRLTTIAVIVAVGTMAVCAAPALGLGTGVNEKVAPAPLSVAEAASLAVQEAAFQAWRTGKAPAPVAGLGALRIIDAPFCYLYTPSHHQITNYYCGPATCQIIDDYWGTCHTQQEYAAYGGMCPTSDGTIFSLLDNTLRHFTGKSYNFYGGLTSGSNFYSRVEYAIGTKHYPMAALVHIDGATDWRPYKLHHQGHIFCLEAFDWRPQADGDLLIRVNDPYDENAAPPSGHGTEGGETYGHHIYHRATIWGGVSETPSRAVVY